MTSGAGHDAVFFSRIAPAAMVFVPCKGGRSHCPEEWSEPEQLAAGTALLFETLRKMDAR
jgi:N-carbamoyl-L-amino-acid hydrolase